MHAQAWTINTQMKHLKDQVQVWTTIKKHYSKLIIIMYDLKLIMYLWWYTWESSFLKDFTITHITYFYA